MTKTLIINAHPDFRNAAHYSVQLEQTFLQLFQTRFLMILWMCSICMIQ